MRENYGKHTLPADNLYQIFSYVKNMDIDNTGNVSGLLLYAKTEEDTFPDGEPIVIVGNRIGARTLDLNRNFTEIAKQLDGIVERF